MNLTHYFKEDKTIYPKSGLKFWVFDSIKVDSFVQDSLVPFREAYIAEAKIQYNIGKYNTKRENEIAEQLPDKGDVMSGDFGEILAFYMACQIWSPSVNVQPMKWRLKNKKKAASPYTDIILFQLNDSSNPDPSDAMYTYEIKTRATKLGNTTYKKHVRPSFVNYKDGKQECTIIEAVFDANKDAVERAAETIPYLLTRCKDMDNEELYHQIFRFSDAVKTTYQKQHDAVAIIDSAHLDEQISRIPSDLLTAHPFVKNVYCLPINDLQQVYEQVYDEMPQKA